MPSSITGSPRPWSEPVGQVGLVPVEPNHLLYRGSSTSQESCYEERCVDPVEERHHKAHRGDVQSKAAEETIGFIPGSADSPPGDQGCGPCAPSSPGSWKNWVCSLLTCGLYMVCRSTILAPSPTGRSPDDDQEKVNLRGLQSYPGANDPQTRKEGRGSGSDWSEDIYIRGVKVDIPKMEEEPVVITRPPLHNERGGGGRLYSPPSYSWYEGDMGDLSMGDVDSLITQKLLELYSEYQIEELAHCTSDSVFLKKTGEISQLISDLAEEHQLDEQDAEGRLVKGIIRISTRKSKKRPPYQRSQRRTSDSGNETMSNYQTSTIGNNNDYDIQISKETDSDMNARNMRMNSGAAESSERQMSVFGMPLPGTSVRTSIHIQHY
ncbi:keratinocyte differentiation factor 1-like isoform X1 [Salvelinus namaycush]|uniref:Keratinocyte differentiation factor 1-like isoform X1 n=1 Tax=Salvelinus namaycush TaxID=8040 RepID=A0A8U0PCF7_SALNM|nr:keratinocyte differentiation factor 1-like isoform X1 [Salvelinus namaycush]XP_038822361.1 keratinocyte differentiation factor 1-like isoform X1 [Salvelinus namaycush]XP_038822362.1 keratinocyte differentiation factor 1-like isoform X1 [Salvelinus namaycush]